MNSNLALPLKIYKSSAGSGKTFTLVKEYLRLCLPNPDRFKYIVAITFTNAASAEMKDRILKTLEDLVEGKGEEMAKLLLSEGITPTQLANAPVLLEKILYNYSLFNVSTIDSFFHRIVRSFNKELEIPSDFEIYINADEALDFAVDQFLYQSREIPDIHRLLIDYIREKIANSQSWNIRADLYKIARELFKDNSLDIPETDLPTIREFIKDLKKLKTDFEDGMNAIASQILNNIRELGLEIEDFKYGKAGALSFVLKSLKDVHTYEPGKRFISGLADENEWYKKYDPNGRLIEEALQTFLFSKCRELYDLFLEDYPAYSSAREVLKNIYTFSVYAEINKMLDEYRAQKNVMLIADFTNILAKHVAKEDISFVYSKIGSRYDHYLIDEFQDTSALQWMSLRPLIENAISQGSSCLLVGDSKQAIYRWRGGSVELIEKHVVEIDFPLFADRQNLNKNFRSRSTIVDFNNAFFQNVAALFAKDAYEYRLLEKIFEDSAQQSLSDLVSGYTEVNFIPKEGRTRENFLEPARALLMEQIKKTLHDGYTLKDITVLVRDKKDAGEVAALMHAEGIAFITQDSLNLDHSPTVRLLLSLLYLLIDPSNELHKTEVLFLYLKYFPLGTDENKSKAENMFETFGHNTPDPFSGVLPKAFIDNMAKLVSLPVYELVEELVWMFGLAEPDAYLQRFQDAVLEFTVKEKGSISGFLDWWDKGKFTVVLPENQDAVQIMTIHKAKGLEFPVVIVPFADWEFTSGKANIIWVNPQSEPFNQFPVLPVNFGTGLKDSVFAEDYEREEALTAIDNLNLLYVAFTRAKHRLYINTRHEKKPSDNGIRNIAQLINQVLKAYLLEPGASITNGEEVPIEVEDGGAKPGKEIFRSLTEYPVYSRISGF